MGDDGPCCPTAAARRIQRIWVDGNQVGIVQMDRIIEEVYQMGLDDDDTIAEALIDRAMLYNYIPPQAVSGYLAGLLEEYREKYPGGDG